MAQTTNPVPLNPPTQSIDDWGQIRGKIAGLQALGDAMLQVATKTGKKDQQQHGDHKSGGTTGRVSEGMTCGTTSGLSTWHSSRLSPTDSSMPSYRELQREKDEADSLRELVVKQSAEIHCLQSTIIDMEAALSEAKRATTEAVTKVSCLEV